METHLGRMTLKEAETRLATRPVVLLPFGAQEAHGPHLPLGADYLVAEEVALRASRLTDAVVAPTMPYGPTPAFKGYAGSVSTRAEITQMLAEDIIINLAAAGRPILSSSIITPVTTRHSRSRPAPCRRARVSASGTSIPGE